MDVAYFLFGRGRSSSLIGPSGPLRGGPIVLEAFASTRSRLSLQVVDSPINLLDGAQQVQNFGRLVAAVVVALGKNFLFWIRLACREGGWAVNPATAPMRFVVGFEIHAVRCLFVIAGFRPPSLLRDGGCGTVRVHGGHKVVHALRARVGGRVCKALTASLLAFGVGVLGTELKVDEASDMMVSLTGEPSMHCKVKKVCRTKAGGAGSHVGSQNAMQTKSIWHL